MIWWNGKHRMEHDLLCIQRNKLAASTHWHTHTLPEKIASMWIPHLAALATTFFLFLKTSHHHYKTKSQQLRLCMDAHLSESDSSELSAHSLLKNDLRKSSLDAMRDGFSYLASPESQRTRDDSWSSAESDVEPDDWLLTDVLYASHALSWTPSAHSRTQISSWAAASSPNKETY